MERTISVLECADISDRLRVHRISVDGHEYVVVDNSHINKNQGGERYGTAQGFRMSVMEIQL